MKKSFFSQLNIMIPHSILMRGRGEVGGLGWGGRGIPIHGIGPWGYSKTNLSNSYDYKQKFLLLFQLMSFGQRVLGKRLFEFLLRKTMYSQFVAGETLPAIQDTIKMLRDCGIGTMLCVPNEEDLSTDYDNFKDRWGYNSRVENDLIKVLLRFLLSFLSRSWILIKNLTRSCKILGTRLE